jgi:hypothetical protein
MGDYHSIIARAVSRSPCATDEARQAIYDQARTALHERLGNDPQISDTQLVNEHHRLEVAIYEVEEGLLLSEMRRFCKRRDGSFPSSLIISKINEFVRSVGDKFVRRPKRIGGVDPLSPAKGAASARRYNLPRGNQSAMAHTIKTIKTPIAT